MYQVLKNVYLNRKCNTKRRQIFLILHYLYLQCLKFIGKNVVKGARSEIMEIKQCLLSLLTSI